MLFRCPAGSTISQGGLGLRWRSWGGGGPPQRLRKGRQQRRRPEEHTWSQERVEGLGRRGWPGHQRVQVHQGCVGTQEGLWGFPGAVGLARGHGLGLRLKGVGACSSIFLRWQRGHGLSYKTRTYTDTVNVEGRSQGSCIQGCQPTPEHPQFPMGL